MKLSELFDSQKEMFNVQRFMDVYGIKIEGEPYERRAPGKNFIDSEYVIKFTIPEAWEPPVEITDFREIQKTFKSMMQGVFRSFWTQTDQDVDEEDLSEMLSLIVFMCRTRRGETWTQVDKEAACALTQQRMDEVRETLRLFEEFQEV